MAPLLNMLATNMKELRQVAYSRSAAPIGLWGMPKFRVRVSGEQLDRPVAALMDAGMVISTGGRLAPSGHVALMVRLDAEGADEARARVEDVLPADGNYTIEYVEEELGGAQEHQALAEDGPLAVDQTLTVEVFGQSGWPLQVVWTTGPGPDQRHLYAFEDMALTPSGVPNYKFVRTLDADEPDPV